MWICSIFKICAAGWRGLALLLGLAWLGGPEMARASTRPYLSHDYDSLARTLTRAQPDSLRRRTLVHLLDLRPTAAASLPVLDSLLAVGRRTRWAGLAPYQAQRRGLALWLAGTDNEAALAAMQQAVAGFDAQYHCVSRLLIDLAPLFNRLNQPSRRLTYFQRQLDLYRLRRDSASAGACYTSLGGQYRRLGDLNRTISYYMRAADLLRTRDEFYYLNCLAVIGASYAEWGNNERALYYFQQLLALPAYAKVQDLRRFFVYWSLSRLHHKAGRYAQALHYAQLGQQVPAVEPAQRPAAQAQALVLVAAAQLHQGPPAAVRPLLERAQHLSDSLHMVLGAKAGEFELDATWAEYYEATHDDQQAEARWRLAYAKATESKLNILRPVYLERLVRFYARRGRSAEALPYARRYLALADSANTEQGKFRVAQYEGERVELVKNTQIATMQQHQAVQDERLRLGSWLLLAAGLTVLVTAGLGAFIYRQLRANRRTLSKLRQAQQQLVQAEKMAFLGQLSAGVAHELQNPLAFMKQFAQVSAEMVDGLANPGAQRHGQVRLDDLKQNLWQISQHGQRASAIIHDMLDHSRPAADRRQPTDLNALATEQLRLAHDGRSARGATVPVALTLDLDPALPAVPAVASELGRALLNLCQNALDAVRGHAHGAGPAYQPAVQLRTQALPDGVVLEVCDNGPGLPDHLRQQVFEPFFTTKPVGEGTGLGLSLAHDIVTNGHGGTLSVLGAEGEGCCFRLWLPRG